MAPIRILAALSLLLGVACARRAPAAAADSASAPSAAPAAPGRADSSASGTEASTTGAPVRAGGLLLTVQAGWVEETPTSSMRKAQYRLPGGEGEGADASLVVFYFGSDAGTIQANLSRWAGQFEQPDGRDSADVIATSSREVSGMPVTEVDLSGTYVAETRPGSGVRVREEGWRMLAAILQAPDGPYYAKLVGPAATVGRWEASFRAFVSAARPAE